MPSNLPTWYSTGTATLANGSASVTGTGTLWGSDAIMVGDLFCDLAQPLVPPQRIASVEGNGALTLAAPWPGTALTDDAYEIRYIGSIERSTAQSRRVLEQLGVVEANGRGLFYRFSDATADADPGSGYLRLNNADPALATALYIDNSDASGGTLAAEIDTWDDSTSLVKGKLWLRSIARPSNFRAYAITGPVVDGTGYRKLTLDYVGGGGTFSANEGIMVFFVPTGDQGDGFATDAEVATTSELAAYEAEAIGFRVFVTDLGTDLGALSGISGVVRLIAGPAWELAARYTGTQGAASTVPGPTGPAGIVWVDDEWNAGTTYAENEGTQREGSSWRSLQAGNLNHAPPSLPTTSNAWWALVARRGIDGAGTVSSIVPGNGIAVDNTDPTAPVISALAPPTTRLEYLNSVRTAKALGSAQYIPDGWVDGFTGNDGIDAGDSSGYTLDTDEGVVQVGYEVVVDQVVPFATGTVIGDMTGQGGISAAFDGVTAAAYAASARCATAGVPRGFVGKDWGLGNEKTLVGVRVWSPTNTVGFQTAGASVAMRIKGSNSVPTAWDGTGYGGTTLYAESGIAAPVGSNTVYALLNEFVVPGGPFRYHWVEITAANSEVYIAEVEFTDTTITPPSDGIIRSIVKTADFEPSEIIVRHEIEPIDALTLGTDVTVSASRDGGTTFTAGTPVQVHTLGTRRMVETAIDVSAQPAGDEVCTLITFLNDKEAKLTGTAEAWTE